MSNLTDHLESLVADCRKADNDLTRIARFAETGGSFRIVITADHPDPEVRDTVQRLAAKFIPTQPILKVMRAGASKEVADCRERVGKLVMSLEGRVA